MNEQLKQAKENVKKAEKEMIKKAVKEGIKKGFVKIIAMLGPEGVAIVVLVAIILAIVLGGTIFLAGAVYYVDWDTNGKAVEAKQQALGDEPLGKVITLDEGKYKIEYEGQDGVKVGKDAIYTILQENGMNFEDFTDEEIECLYKALKAEWATAYPNLGQDVDNKDLDTEFVQGVITIKRGKSDGTIINLEYKPYEEFTNIKDESALNYFSMKDGAIVVASWSSTQTEYKLEKTERSKDIPDDIKNQYIGTGEQISISETVINYRDMIGVHRMPFEFLLALLVNTEDVDFVSELADLAFNSTIEITVYDNTIEIISENTELTTEITTYVKEADWYRYKTTETTNSEGEYQGGYTSIDGSGHEKFDSEDIDILEYNVTTTTTTKSNSYVVGLTKVDSWICKLENIYTHSTTTEKEDYGAGEPFSQKVTYDPVDISITDTEIQAILNNKRKSDTQYTDEDGITYRITYTYDLRNAKMIATLEVVKKITKNTNTTNEYKYENTSKSTSDIGKRFKEIYDKHPKAQAQIDSVASWLFELLEETESSIDYVSIMKYLLYICTGEDYGITEEEIKDLLKKSETVSYLSTGNISAFGCTMTKESFIAAAKNYKKDNSTYQSKMAAYAEDFYDVCTKYNVNPVIAYAHACLETGHRKFYSI